MNLVNIIRKNILYAFLALPLLLISYEGIMTLGVGSRAWGILFVGQLILVTVSATIFSFVFDNYLNNPVGVLFLFIICMVTPIILILYAPK